MYSIIIERSPMDRSISKDCRRRWSANRAKLLLAKLNRHPLQRDGFPEIEIDGTRYIDLRGFKPPKTILRLKADHIDFSYSVLPCTAGLGNVQLANCLFVGA